MTALRTSPSPSCGPIQQGTRTPSLCSTRTASLPPPTPSTAAVSARCRVSRAVWTTTAFGSGWKSSSAGPGHSSPHPSSPPHASLPRYCAHTLAVLLTPCCCTACSEHEWLSNSRDTAQDTEARTRHWPRHWGRCQSQVQGRTRHIYPSTLRGRLSIRT